MRYVVYQDKRYEIVRESAYEFHVSDGQNQITLHWGKDDFKIVLKVQPRACAKCGKVFKPEPGDWQVSYCSGDCRIKDSNRKQDLPPLSFVKRICLLCGVAYQCTPNAAEICHVCLSSSEKPIKYLLWEGEKRRVWYESVGRAYVQMSDFNDGFRFAWILKHEQTPIVTEKSVGRPRHYSSNAERQKAYRERKRQAVGG
ncbi:MAG: hypothetical protein MUF38_01560 [Anaerolineae bacterium]|jgi:hypothetical protein|nr:hypothetical protein [Anaerolineae bacterium]